MNNVTPQTPDEMKEKIDAFRHRVFDKKCKAGEVSSSLNVVMTILSDLIGGLLVGAGIGYVFYKFFNAHLAVLGVFVLLGGLAGLSNLYKSLKRLEGSQK